jgi:hypothetical protein
MSIVTNPSKGIVVIKERGLRGATGPSSVSSERIEISLANPIAQPFSYIFPKNISTDANNSPLVQVELNGLSAVLTDDFTIDLNTRTFTWISPITLIANDKLVLRYVPSSIPV